MSIRIGIKIFTAALALGASGLPLSLAFAQTPDGAHTMPAMPAMTAPNAAAASDAAASPSSEAFKAADEHMMQQMSQAYTGHTDQDFVSHMLPHHEGAVAMAKIELQYGKDPQLRRLARNIIKAQDSEIKFMKRWQAKHPAPGAAPAPK